MLNGVAWRCMGLGSLRLRTLLLIFGNPICRSPTLLFQIAKFCPNVDETPLIRPLGATKSCMVLIPEPYQRLWRRGADSVTLSWDPSTQLQRYGRVVAVLRCWLLSAYHSWPPSIAPGSKSTGVRC
jgi:hypothetical protein